MGAGSAVDELVSYKARVAGAVGAVANELLEGEFETHDGYAAAPGVYRARASEARSAKRVRDDLLFALAPFGPTEVAGLPAAAGNAHGEFFIQATVIERPDRFVTLVALAPDGLRESEGTVRFRLADLTNTTNVARAQDDSRLRCHPFPSDTGAAAADFYWVLDQSTSMRKYYDEVGAFAADFYAKLENTSLDFRLGVTPMDANAAYSGKLRVPPEGPGWISPETASPAGGAADFIGEIEEYVEGCGSLTPRCSPAIEHGLYAASVGIERMSSSTAPANEEFRSGAQLATITISDAEDYSYHSPSSEPRRLGGDKQAVLDFYTGFFARNPLLFSIYNPVDAPCPEAESSSVAYQAAALASGGAAASLCEGLEETIDTIIDITAGRASRHVLPQTPISSTLRVYQTINEGKDRLWVPRSRTDGFDFFPQSNAVAFYGRLPTAAGLAPGVLDDARGAATRPRSAAPRSACRPRRSTSPSTTAPSASSPRTRS